MRNHDVVRMANRIAGYFQSYPREEAVAATAAHLRSFWDPRLRHALFDHAAAAEGELHEIVVGAVRRLQATAAER